MIDQWFSVIRLPISLRQFYRLPQNSSYKYDYNHKNAVITPSPKYFHAHLTLGSRAIRLCDQVNAQERVVFRQLEDGDWPRLPRLFVECFRQVQPFASLSGRRRLTAARECLEFTRGDGPIIKPACYVAMSDGSHQILGAILVTLVPEVDLQNVWNLRWESPPPVDCIDLCLGQAHLTWIFVSPVHSGYGVGTELLGRVVQKLLELGYTGLLSTFILGNDTSMLWHWRNGFELLPYSGSLRTFRAIMRSSNQQE